MTDKLLWQDIADGDKVAYEKLYTNYFKKFYNYGKKFTSNALLVEDCIQEVFLEIWKNRGKIRDMHSPNSYFFSTFRFILLKKLRQSTEVIKIDALDGEPHFLIQSLVNPGGTSFELTQRLQAALSTLTSRQREIIFLRFYEGLSYEEAAAVLNISVKATYKIMARSLQSLKKSLSLSLLIILLLLGLFKL